MSLFWPSFCFVLHIQWEKQTNGNIFHDIFLKSEWGSHNHMNHTQETGMEVKGKLDKLLALDGTKRMEKTHTKYSKSSTQLTMVNNNGTRSQKATGACSFPSSHSSQASHSLQPQELFCAAMSQKRCLKTLKLCNGHTSYWQHHRWPCARTALMPIINQNKFRSSGLSGSLVIVSPP